MDPMLDAGFCLPTTCPLVPVRLAMLGKRAGLAWQAGRLRLPFGPSSSTLSSLPKGSWPRAGEAGGDTGFLKEIILIFQHQASSIQYLAHYVINDRFHDIVIFGSGSSCLGYSNLRFDLKIMPTVKKGWRFRSVVMAPTHLSLPGLMFIL
jgi:hypothetical protein